MEAARRLGVDLTVASEQPSTLEAANPAGFLTLDLEQPERAADAARLFAKEYPINGVAGVDDKTALVAAAIAMRLGLKGNPVHAAMAASDKYLQREQLAQARVPVPRFMLRNLEEDPGVIAKSIPYPCVVKPVRLSASRGVIRADNPQAFVAAHGRLSAILHDPATAAACGDRARHYLIEEFIPGYEVALEALVVNRRLHVLAIFDKPDPLDGPFFEETIYVTPSSVPAGLQSAIKDCADRAVRALGIIEGPIHAELRYNERGPCLIELAARPIGGRCSAALRFGAGVTLEEIIIRHALGMPIPSLEREAQAAGVMMIPIPGAGTLKEVRGIAEAKAVPLIEDVQITAHPGERLVPFPEGSRYPGFIFARGETPAMVESALRTAHRKLEFTLLPQQPPANNAGTTRP